MHPSKCVQKNILKTWDFTKNKLCHRYFDNNSQKIFRTNILENGIRQIILIVVLMDGLLFNPLMPEGLFKYVWSFCYHQALKG